MNRNPKADFEEDSKKEIKVLSWSFYTAAVTVEAKCTFWNSIIMYLENYSNYAKVSLVGI